MAVNLPGCTRKLAPMSGAPFANGAPDMGANFRVHPGRFTAIGRRVGMLSHQRYAPMFSICCASQGGKRLKQELTRTHAKEARELNIGFPFHTVIWIVFNMTI